MTRMLASVTNVEEAEAALAERADIIDLKNPAEGALGRLDFCTIRELLDFIDGRCPVSATIGDLPMEAQLVFDASQAIAATGVDYIKVGLAGDEAGQPVIEKLAPLASEYRLIAVLFADWRFDFQVVENLKTAGFSGVMLDTFDKERGSLAELMSLAELYHFVAAVKSKNMLCGLAGSLKLADIPVLAGLRPDYLGFRGALCYGLGRTEKINRAAVRTLKKAISQHGCR